MIRNVEARDAQRIAEIYNHYIAETVITFEESPVSAGEILTRIESISESGLPWIVCESESDVVGYAYATGWRTRAAYRFTVESAVYVAVDQLGKGIGVSLYGALLEALRVKKLHSVMGLIALPNPASVKLHERLGFRKVGEHREVGWKFDRWIDVGCWQLMLESDA